MKKYLILSLLGILLIGTFSTCHDCVEEYPINGPEDFPQPFRVVSADFFSADVPGTGWFVTFNKAVDLNSIRGGVNLKATGQDVVFTGYFFPLDSVTIFISYCEFATATALPGGQPLFSYTLELSGDGDQPLLSTNGQALDGDGDATDGGVFSKNTTQSDCGSNYVPVVSPDNGSSANLQVQPGKTIDLSFVFEGVRMDTSSFKLGETVLVTDLNNNPVPANLQWDESWHVLQLSTTQPVEQVCTGNFCQLTVVFKPDVKTAFGKSLSDGYLFTALIN